MDIFDVIKRERNSGCHDAAVFGGFGLFISGRGAALSLAELTSLGRAYTESAPAERPALLAQIESLLRASGADLSLPQQAPARIMPGTLSGKQQPDRDVPSLALPLLALKSVGSKRAEAFARLGLRTLGDLLEFFPRDYLDRREVTPIAGLAIGALGNIRGAILKTEQSRSRRGMSILYCYVRDESGIIPLVWFNQPFLEKKLVPGNWVTAYGRVEKRFDSLAFLVQDYQLDTETVAAPGILPVYPLSNGLTQKILRHAVFAAWERCQNLIEEVLPQALRDKRSLLPRRAALAGLHFPVDLGTIEQARRSLAYEELLAIQLAIISNAAPDIRVERPPSDNAALRKTFAAALPYALTGAQRRVIDEIYADLDLPRPMSRLVQGDVGSGKTAVAAAAIYKCCAQGRQAALMAPTEILARQHHHNLEPLLLQLGLTAALLTGGTPPAERRAVLAGMKNGELNCIIGTHALIQNDVAFAELGLAITDEQHRFGVAQRARLRNESAADMLIMTATPIPRTLAMTLYADLKLSLIDELPPGRRPVQTYAVDYRYEQRIERFIDLEVAKGRQAFIVCPLIEESDKLELASATQIWERLSKEVFPHRQVSLLTGKMKSAEKDRVMGDFRAHKSDILVATTVIEVGVDIPNATVMLIRDAERFGLAQLHQLRGRIGRGGEQSYCILLHNAQSGVARERMRIISATADGFRLAEADLEQRGPGEFFGERQHGLPELKIADLSRDAKLLAAAHEDAALLTAGQLPMTAALRARVEQMARLFT